MLHKLPFLAFLFAFLIVPGIVSAAVTHDLDQNLSVNKTFTLDSGGGTPATLWVGAIVLGVILLLISFISFQNGEEGLVSIMAWIPLAYAMYTALKVDVITNAGTVATASGITQVESHTIYQFNLVAILLMIALAFAIGNTYRIWVSQKKMQALAEGPQADMVDY